MEYRVVKKTALYDSEVPGTGKVVKQLPVGSVVIVEEIKQVGRRSIVNESGQRAKISAPFVGWCSLHNFKGEELLQEVKKASSAFTDANYRTNRHHYGEVKHSEK